MLDKPVLAASSKPSNTHLLSDSSKQLLQKSLDSASVQQEDLLRIDEAEASKIEDMKLKVEELKRKQERQAYRNMNLERMRLILNFAYTNKFEKPREEGEESKRYENKMITKIVQRRKYNHFASSEERRREE